MAVPEAVPNVAEFLLNCPQRLDVDWIRVLCDRSSSVFSNMWGMLQNDSRKNAHDLSEIVWVKWSDADAS